MPFRRRFSGARPRYEWTSAQAVTPTVVTVNTLQTVLLLSAATLEEWPRGSLVRILGSMFISPATAPAAASGYGVFLGLYWVQVSGGSQTLDPEVSPEFGWKWWHVLFPQIGGNAAADSNASRWAGYFPIQFDLKHHHRFTDNEGFNLAVKNSNLSAASIQFSFAFRFLIRAGR